MTARLAVSAEGEDLISTFSAELVTAGLTAWPSTVGGARAFCARYPLPEQFATAGIDEQLALPARLSQFACWLMVTGRMRMSAEYLARADLRLGAVAAHYHPRLRARLADAAVMLGSDHVWVVAQWNALTQLGAFHGVPPGEVTVEQLDTGGTALLAAFARPGHPKAGHRTRSALVRLRATMFHAGTTDTPPRLHKPNTGAVRADEPRVFRTVVR